MTAIKIGCDPELFVSKGGIPVSAHTLIPGTKEHPHGVDNGAIQVDGTALEFNTLPAETSEQFVFNVSSVLAQLRELVPEEYEFNITPSVEYPEEYIRTLPREAVELGCNPDYNAYSGGQNEPPNGEATTLRTASGHIHIGWTEGEDPLHPVHMEQCCLFVKQLDAVLGVLSLLVDPDTKRRELYGKAGAFRPKSYGVEYRVLSNFWIKDPAMVKWVFEATQWAFDMLVEGTLLWELLSADPAETINTGYTPDARRAYRAFRYMRKPIPAIPGIEE